jgi:hypothetical protein
MSEDTTTGNNAQGAEPVNTISLATAQEWANRWRSNPNNTVNSHLVLRINITQLMAQKDTVDIRVYHGVDSEGLNKLMLVGVDANGNDLIDESNGHFIFDFNKPCPPYCPSSDNLLNTL